MCQNHGTSVCKSAEASLKGSITTLKRLRAEAMEMAEKSLQELRASGVDTNSAEALMQRVHALIEGNHARAQEKLDRLSDRPALIAVG